MMKKSLFFGTAARSIAPAIASLLVLFAFVGCSNPSSGTTEYVAQLVGDEFEYPAGTVFAETFEELLGVLNDTLEVTNGVTYVAYNGGVSTFSQDLIIPAGKIVYLNAYDTSDTIADGFDDDNGQLSDNIIVEPGATLVLVTNLKTDGAGNQLLVKGLVEVYGALIIGTNALDVADYHEQANGTFEAVNTVIGKNVAVKAGGILALRGIDIKLANDSSHDRFTPAEAWAYTGQGSLEITDVKDSNYSVAYLLTGVSPSASRYYSVTTNGGGDLPPLIPQGAYITANGTITDTTDHNLTVNGELRADATTATFKNIVNLTVNGVLQANNASFESVENLIISSVNTENVSRASIAPYKPRGGWLGADKATLKKAKNINIGDNGVFESESTAIDLPADTEIVLGKSAAFNASGATLNTFAEVVRIFIGPASQVVLGSTDVSLESLKSLTVKDGGFLVSPGTFTFKLDQPAVQGKNALIAGKYKADAEVDLVFNGDTTLVNFSGIISGGISEYVITEKSTLAIADGATVTVPSGVTLNLSALKLPTTAAPDAPVKISGTIQVAAGGKVIGPNIAGLTDTDKAALFTTFDFGSDGKVLLDWGADFKMGTGTTVGTDVMYMVGANGGGADAYEWCASSTDGAQIEINNAGIIIRDANPAGGVTYAAALTIAGTNVLQKEQTLTLEKGVVLTAPAGLNLWVTGDTNGGAKLLGEGSMYLSGGVYVTGGQYGWQAYGTGVIGIGNNGYGPSIATLATGPTLRALGPGATITLERNVGNALVVGANTTIELGGNDRAVGGAIILTDGNLADKSKSGKLTLAAATSKITTGNSVSGTQTSAVVLADDYVTSATGTTIGEIGIPYLAGDGTVIKVTPTVAAVDGKVPAGRIISLEGGATSASITGGDATVSDDEANDGIISSLTLTAEKL